MIVSHRKALAIVAPQLLAAELQKQLGNLTATYLAAFDLLGRAHVIEYAQRKSGHKIKLATTTTIPNFDDGGGVLGFESVPFTQAIDRVLKLIGMSRNAFDGLSQRYKAQAFTIAGISDVKLIEQIKQALADVMQSGGTDKDFQAAVNALTDQAGINRLASTQISTVFQTAVQTAYQNGRFEQMTSPEVMAALPFWVYRTAGDDRVRPAHAALDGFAARVGDPVWNRLYPPCGYNCRCTVTAEGPDDVSADADQPGLSRIPAAAAMVHRADPRGRYSSVRMRGAPMGGDDFVNVRLTEFGESLKQVVVHEGGTPDPKSAVNHREFVFRPGDVQRVTRAFEWEKVLRRQEQDGKPLFEIVPAEEVEPLHPIFETTEQAAHDPRIALPVPEKDQEVKS